eukprot:6412793-Prymnesium_polylepis.1
MAIKSCLLRISAVSVSAGTAGANRTSSDRSSCLARRRWKPGGLITSSGVATHDASATKNKSRARQVFVHRSLASLASITTQRTIQAVFVMKRLGLRARCSRP